MQHTADYHDLIRELSDELLSKRKRSSLLDGHISDILSRNDLLRLCTLHEMMVEERAAGGFCSDEWVYDCEGMNHLVAKYLLTQNSIYLKRAQDMVISANRDAIEEDLSQFIFRNAVRDPSGPYDRAYMGATL